jgi:hypothetical protein
VIESTPWMEVKEGYEKGAVGESPPRPRFWNLEVELCAKLKYPGIVGRRHLSEVSIRTA